MCMYGLEKNGQAKNFIFKLKYFMASDLGAIYKGRPENQGGGGDLEI